MPTFVDGVSVLVAKCLEQIHVVCLSTVKEGQQAFLGAGRHSKEHTFSGEGVNVVESKE